MSRVLSSLVGAVVEAWAELRIHRTRVLLSLIGVAVAVAALTGVVALSAIAQQASAEQFERSGGRPATLQVSIYSNGTSPIGLSEIGDAIDGITERYRISWDSPNAYASARAKLSSGPVDVQLQLVSDDFATMRRTVLEEGSWFTTNDALRLAPAIVINDAFWQQMGSPDLRTHPVLDLISPNETSAVVIGVAAAQYPDESPTAFMLYDPYIAAIGPEVAAATVSPNWEFWVPEDIADELQGSIPTLVKASLGQDVGADVYRNDYAANGSDPFEAIRLVAGGIALLVLFLGALSLVNISLVTIRQRIREIGIRRSFGATAGRVFFAVMMESVVATLAAGVVGVFLAVLVVRSPLVLDAVAPGIVDVPAFPIDAALIGLASATAVGALAGLLPALVAVRVKVIDAIRY